MSEYRIEMPDIRCQREVQVSITSGKSYADTAPGFIAKVSENKQYILWSDAV
jgi:hypothetical protein